MFSFQVLFHCDFCGGFLIFFDEVVSKLCFRSFYARGFQDAFLSRFFLDAFLLGLLILHFIGILSVCF